MILAIDKNLGLTIKITEKEYNNAKDRYTILNGLPEKKEIAEKDVLLIDESSNVETIKEEKVEEKVEEKPKTKSRRRRKNASKK